MKNCILFGAGYFGKNAYYKLKHFYNILYYVDNNEELQGKKLFDIEIVSLSQMVKSVNTSETDIIICSNAYVDIAKQLRSLSINDYYVMLNDMYYVDNNEELILKHLNADRKMWREIVEVAVSEYKKRGISYIDMLCNYKTFGEYLDFTIDDIYKNYEISFDAAGSPKIKYGDIWVDNNPVTIAEFALSYYSSYIKGDKKYVNDFLTYAENLLGMQGEDGACRYNYSYKYYLNNKAYAPGWVSGMAQGHALSVYARAYHLTNDIKWVNAGDKCMEFMITPVEKGGVMDTLYAIDSSLSQYIIFEEYLSTPATYTLNGFQYAILGLYDWSQIKSDTKCIAQSYFDKSIETCKIILQFYDLDGFTAYDLGYMTHKLGFPHIGVRYHKVHTALCHVLWQLTGDKVFEDYFHKWADYVK